MNSLRIRLLWTSLVISAVLTTTVAADPVPEHWWHNYTTIFSHPNQVKDIRDPCAQAVRCAGYFGGWYGYWFIDMQKQYSHVENRQKDAQQANLKRIIYFDGGEIGDFAGFLSKDNKLLYTGWSLPSWNGVEPLSAHWIGLENFMKNVPWAPYPTASAYNLEPFNTPDGKLPQDFYGNLAACDMYGKYKWMFSCNPRITDDIARRSGLADISAQQENPPEVKDRTGWQTTKIVTIDYSNPQLRKYMCSALARLLAEDKPDGVHIDNFGDMNIFYPRGNAFGAWSLAGFHSFLSKRFTPQQLQALGVQDIDNFDIRTYIEEKPFESRGHPWQYLNPRWLDDPLWMAYVIYKVQTGLETHRAVYQTAKKQTQKLGLDCAVFGNTVPLAPARAFMKGTCDIAHFEYKSDRRMGSLPGVGLPPFTHAGGVTRLGAAISDAPYCWPSLYVPQHLSGEGHENLHKVLAFDCLANRGLMDFGHQYLDGYSPGTSASAACINSFIKTHRQILNNRKYLPDLALVYSEWTNLASITVSHLKADEFIEEYLGWAAWLSDSHTQWDVVLSNKMTYEILKPFRMIILPTISVLTDPQVQILRQYLAAGSLILATGQTGARLGPDDLLMRRKENALASLSADNSLRITSDKPGVNYLCPENPEQRTTADQQMKKLMDFPTFQPTLITNAPDTLGVNLNIDSDTPRLTLDLNNKNLNPDTDQLTPSPPCQVKIHLPDSLNKATLKVSYFEPRPCENYQPIKTSHDQKLSQLTLAIPPVFTYMLVIIE